EQVARDLHAYRRAIRRRHGRLPGDDAATRLLALVDRVEHAAAPLIRYVAVVRPISAVEFTAALRASLERAGLAAGFAADAAGQRVLEELDAMDTAAAAAD